MKLHGPAGRSFQFIALMLVMWGIAPAAHAELVGLWNFDGTLDDSSGFLNNGTLSGDPLPSFSNDVPAILGAGQSLFFNGSSGHVLVPDSDSLDLASAITIAAWVKTAGGIQWDGILAKSPSDGSASNHAGNYELRIENGTRVPTFLHQRGGFNDTAGYAGGVAVPDNTWTHVAVTAENGGAAKFYVNGVPAGTAGLAGLFGAINSSPLYIGSRADLFTTMDGFMDDVRLYNNALSAADVYTLATGITPGNPYPRIAGVTARASTEYLPDGRTAASAVNGNGLVGTWHVENPPGGNMWLSDNETTPTFEMDLGGVHKVDQLRVWNYNENANPVCCLGRGVQTADIYVAGKDGVYGATPVITGATFTQAPGTQTDFSQVVSLGDVSARYVKVVVTSNYGDPSYTGLSEINATGTAIQGLSPLSTGVQSVSSNLAGFNRAATYVTDRSGLEFGNHHGANPDGTMWLSQGTLPGGNPDTAPQITFDLGSVKTLDHMQVWNYNEYRPDLPDRTQELLGRGVAFTNVSVAGEDLVFAPWLDFLELERAPEVGNTADFSQIVNLLGVSARYVRFDILSNYNGKDFLDPLSDDGLFNFVGLSEVEFFEPRFAGDANADGVVDFADLGILLNSYNQPGTFDNGDFDGNGIVEFTDLGLLLNNYNESQPVPAFSQAGPVPEPSTLWLAGLGAVGLACRVLGRARMKTQ